MKNNDTELMVGYETLELKPLIFETSSSRFQKSYVFYEQNVFGGLVYLSS